MSKTLKQSVSYKIYRAYTEGRDAVRARPHNAPRNPYSSYNDDGEVELHEGWERGAFDAGINEIYTNGKLNIK